MQHHLGYAIIVIAVLTLFVWAVSQFIQPILPDSMNSNLILLFTAFLAVVSILSKFKDVVELFEKVFGKKPDKLVQLTPAQKDRYREIMIRKVESFWIKGVFENSLQGTALINLGIEYRPESVNYPLRMIVQRPDQNNKSVLHGTRIIDIFDESGGEILILGGPGSGKTTMLLLLARELISRARDFEKHSIPVVLNLESWAEKQRTIHDWLVDELKMRYLVPSAISQLWLENDDLILLLDGLDEIKFEFREDCVKSINEFHQKHGLTGLAICSRGSEYESLRTHLRLQNAILLQPLTHQQIHDYLQNAGIEFAAVRKTLENDRLLGQLSRTPLFLDIMALAYRNSSIEELGSLDSIDARRTHLFDAYIKKMFERRVPKQDFDPVKTISWLKWLAEKMVQNSQMIFMVDQIQPSMLDYDSQRMSYAIGFRIVFALLYGIIFMLAFSIGSTNSPFGSEWIHSLGWSFNGILFSLLLSSSVKGRRIVWNQEIRTFESLSWSWRNAISRLPEGLSIGSFFGFGISIAYLVSTNNPMHISDLWIVNWLVSIFSFGLYVMILFGIGFGLFGGFHSRDFELRTEPNQGIWASLGNSIKVGVSLTLFVGVFVALTSKSLDMGISIGLIAGLIGGSQFGGLTFVQHFTLRFILFVSGILPWNLIDFLDNATLLIFLRKVGGGYIFIHRLMMEHLAELETK